MTEASRAVVVTSDPTSEIRDGMRIQWDVEIPMADGLVLKADVFRPIESLRYPVLLSYGPYAKGLAFQEGYPVQWNHMVQDHPDVLAGSSNKYQSWELVDPEKWVTDGYVVVRVDSRGAGHSPGLLDVWSPQEARDLYECIEWAGVQCWSNGRVGLAGISYYAMNQYQVASLQPPHLAAICPWEGASDWYREFSRHGGILCEFAANWYRRQVEGVQYGVGERGLRSDLTGEWIAGPETLPEETLVRSQRDLGADIRSHLLLDSWFIERNPDWSKITVPMLTAANWGGQGLHLRGNITAFTEAASEQKWLEVHGGAHWVEFYTDYGVQLQKRFFAHFLKDAHDGWEAQPRVQLQIRHVDGSFALRHEHEWPLARTQWTRLYLDPEGRGLCLQPVPQAGALRYDALGQGVTFVTPPLTEETEVTGPMSAKLFISSSTQDADLFLVVRVFDPRGDEVTFMGALDPNTPIAQGWLRASHRKLDPAKSRPYQPVYTHDEIQPLTPETVYEVDVEIWPSCIVIPPGYQVALSVRGKDYEYMGQVSEFAKTFHYAGGGVGPFKHNDPDDRPKAIFGGSVTLYAGGSYPSYLLVPVVPRTRR